MTGLRPISRPDGLETWECSCKSPMKHGANPSHYLTCPEVLAAFGPPITKSKTGNKPGYIARAREVDDPSTWTKVCSVPGCGAPVKRTGYCKLHQADYMILWRKGESRPRTKGCVRVKRVRPDADPAIT